MSRTLALISLLMGLLTAGCSHIHALITPVRFEVVHPEPLGREGGMAGEELRARLEASQGRAVLLPFADYSPYVSPPAHSASQDSLRNALKEALGKIDMQIAGSKEEVTRYLCREGLILNAAPILREESPRTALLLRELEGGWSEEMRGEIGKALHQNLMEMRTGAHGDADSRPLVREAILALGDAFGADYVIRGRITVHQRAFKWSEHPRHWERLAFYFTGPDKGDLEVAVATIDAYEYFDREVLLPPGASAGSGEKRPFDEDQQKITPLVRVDLFVQDAGTGDVLYVQAAEVRSVQILSLSPQQGPERYELMDRALQEAAQGLIQPLL